MRRKAIVFLLDNLPQICYIIDIPVRGAPLEEAAADQSEVAPSAEPGLAFAGPGDLFYGAILLMTNN
jgi:hypothetical protein